MHGEEEGQSAAHRLVPDLLFQFTIFLFLCIENIAGPTAFIFRVFTAVFLYVPYKISSKASRLQFRRWPVIANVASCCLSTPINLKLGSTAKITRSARSSSTQRAAHSKRPYVAVPSSARTEGYVCTCRWGLHTTPLDTTLTNIENGTTHTRRKQM